MIDVSGQSIRFVDTLATIGGGNITLTTAFGSIAIQAGRGSMSAIWPMSVH